MQIIVLVFIYNVHNIFLVDFYIKNSPNFRYADDSFTSAFVATVGIDFKVKTVFRQDKRVKLQIWVRL